MKTDVSVIIVTWNGKHQTLECLSSLAKLSSGAVRLHTIVVDNGSSDGTKNEIEKKFENVKVIALDKNFGFTGGNNVGIAYALKNNTDVIWLLNNDTIVDTKALSIVNRFEDSGVGIAGSKIYFAPGHEYHKDRYNKKDRGKVLWYAGGQIDWDNMYSSHRGVDEVDIGQYDKVIDTPFVTGCSMMVASSVFKKIGLFDDKYYLYLEDVDFCIRARRAGFRVLYVPSSVIWHLNANSSGGPGSDVHNYYLTRNRYLIGFRYAPLRTKVALLREAFWKIFSTQGSMHQGAVDALLGRYGKRYEVGTANN